jgi:non-specific serine/threonine protein kinase
MVGAVDQFSERAGADVLSPREREVAALIARGYTNQQIAQELTITKGTADSHVVHILDKLGFSSRAQVAVWAAEHGLHRPPAA